MNVSEAPTFLLFLADCLPTATLFLQSNPDIWLGVVVRLCEHLIPQLVELFLAVVKPLRLRVLRES